MNSSRVRSRFPRDRAEFVAGSGHGCLRSERYGLRGWSEQPVWSLECWKAVGVSLWEHEKNTMKWSIINLKQPEHYQLSTLNHHHVHQPGKSTFVNHSITMNWPSNSTFIDPQLTISSSLVHQVSAIVNHSWPLLSHYSPAINHSWPCSQLAAHNHCSIIINGQLPIIPIIISIINQWSAIIQGSIIIPIIIFLSSYNHYFINHCQPSFNLTSSIS